MSNLPILFTLHPFLYDGFYKAYFEIKDSSFENLPELAKSAYSKLEKWAARFTETKKFSMPNLTETEMNYININWIRKQPVKNILAHCVKTNSELFFDYIFANISRSPYQYTNAFIHAVKECKFDFATKLLEKFDKTYLNVINLISYIYGDSRSIEFLEENKLHILDVTKNNLINVLLFGDKKLNITHSNKEKFTKSKIIIYRSDNTELFQYLLENNTYDECDIKAFIKLPLYDKENIKRSKIIEYIAKSHYDLFKEMLLDSLEIRSNDMYLKDNINYNNAKYISTLIESKEDKNKFINIIVKNPIYTSTSQCKPRENIEQLYDLYNQGKENGGYIELTYHLGKNKLNADIIYLYDNKEELQTDDYANDVFDSYDIHDISDDMLKWFVDNGASNDSLTEVFIEVLSKDPEGYESLKKFIPHMYRSVEDSITSDKYEIIKDGLKVAIKENIYDNSVLLLKSMDFDPKFINKLIEDLIKKDKAESTPILVYLCKLFVEN
jgi:hypothetical protein